MNNNRNEKLENKKLYMQKKRLEARLRNSQEKIRKGEFNEKKRNERVSQREKNE